MILEKLLNGNEEAFEFLRKLISDGINKKKTGSDGVLTPTKVSDLNELKAQIVKAKNEGKKIRVVGGQHSINEAICDKDKDLLIYLAGDFRKMEHTGGS